MRLGIGIASTVTVGALLVPVLLVPSRSEPVAADTNPCAQPAQVAVDLPAGNEQLRNATGIVQVAFSLGLDARAAQIGIATAMVESNLINVNYGDRDSLGLFQQRPSQGWGTPAQVTDPTYAAGKFYEKLMALPWQTMGFGQAAQAVQRSAFPTRYDTKATAAAALYGQVQTGQPNLKPVIDPDTQLCSDPGAASGGSFADAAGGFDLPRANPRSVADAIAWAKAEAASGHGGWYRRCLAFVAVAYGWQFSGVDYAIDKYKIDTPADMRHDGDRNPPPGALMFWSTSSRAGHVAVSVGGGMIASNDIVEAGKISVVPAGDIESKWGSHYEGWAPPYFPRGG